MPDLFTSADARDIALTAVNSCHGWWINRAKELAILHAAKQGEVSADDLYTYIEKKALHPVPSRGCMGSVFRDKRLKFIRYEPSKRIARHANRNGVYEMAT